MEAKAYLRYVRISPRKIQIVCDLIRGKDAGTAMAILAQTPKAASEPLTKLLKSAVANAENNFGMDPAKLDAAVKLLRQHNEKAAILTTPWDQLTGAQIVEAMAGGHSLAHQLMAEIAHEHGIEHHDDHCCCGHDHEEKHEMCCHDHGEEGHDHCCEHGHTHEEGHHHDHDSCCCGHDHEHVENSMDTDWDVSGVDPSQYRLLFSTLGAIAGVKDVGLNPDGLKIIHTPEALPAIKQAFDANNLKLKMRTNEGKETTQIRIQQMDCPTEEGLIRKKLNGMKGVSGLQFNLMNRVLTVSYPKGMLPETVAAIKSLDYTPEVLEAHEKPKLSEFKPTKIAWWKYILGIVIAVVICYL